MTALWILGGIAIGVVAIAVMSLATACGKAPHKASFPNYQTDDSKPKHEERGREKPLSHIDMQLTPPKEYFDAALADAMNHLGEAEMSLTENVTHVLYLNFDGAQISQGYRNGQSFIACQDSSSIAPASFDASERETIRQQVVAHFSKVGVSLDVTLDEPAKLPYTTMIVGGSYSDIGCVGSGVLGIAPFDQGNVNDSDIGFAFTDGVNELSIVC